MSDDDLFWDRLAGMPATEQEQECVLRREHNALAMAVLSANRLKAKAAGRDGEARAIGVDMSELMGQMTLLNERIKYLRRVLDNIKWRSAVKEVLGQDAYDECAAWIAQQEVQELPA